MKYLAQFQKFDIERFSEGKEFRIVECSPLTDRQSNRIIGTVVTVVVFLDNTDYGPGKTGSNLYEKLRFKILDKQLSLPTNARVVPVNPVAKVYGDYNNQLSVVCDDVRVIEKKDQK